MKKNNIFMLEKKETFFKSTKQYFCYNSAKFPSAV